MAINQNLVDYNSSVTVVLNQSIPKKDTPSIPHVTNNYISLQITIGSLILFTHKKFRNILETLPATNSDLSKKRRLLEFIVKIRTEFVKVYVLTKWAKVSKDISATIDVVSWLNGQQNCFRNLINVLFGIEKNLSTAKLRTPDIETALEVLTAGRPAQSSRNFFPPKKLDSTTILQTLHDLDILLSIRLALTEKLPPEFSHYRISDGRVTFFVENSYQVQLGIADDSVNARFFLVDFKFDFPGAFSPSQMTKSRLEVISNDILAKKGLVDLFEMLLKFTQNYKLSTYYNDLKELEAGLYSDLISSKFYPDKSLVTVHYWLSATQNYSSKNFINIGLTRNNKIGIIWIRDNQVITNHGIEFGQRLNSVENLLQQIATLHVKHIISSVFNLLARMLETNTSVKPNSYRTPSLSSSKQSKLATSQRSIYLNTPNRNDQASSPQSPSTQTSSTPNTPASVDSQLKSTSQDYYGNNNSYNYDIITTISPEKLKIRLTGSRFTVFSIDRLTGKAILSNSTRLISSVEAAINESQGRINIIADLLIKLRLTSIQEEICHRANAAGWIAKSNLPLHSSVVKSKFPPDTRIIFCLRQPLWPERWFLLVSLNLHGLSRWWITQMSMKEGSWGVGFVEEILISQEELDKNYSYTIFSDLNSSILTRIRTEALRKELDRCKIKYRLIQSNSNDDTLGFNLSSNNPAMDSVPVAMFDISSLCEESKWAEKSVFMRLGSTNDKEGTINVIIQGRTKHTLSIGSMPSDDPTVKFTPTTGIFYLFLTIRSNTIPNTKSSNILSADNNTPQSSELIEKVSEKFAQIENVVNYITLLRSLSLRIIEASMFQITFEYGPLMTASITLPLDKKPNKDILNKNLQVTNYSQNSDTNTGPKKSFDETVKHESNDNENKYIAINGNRKSITLRLHEGSPHKIVEALLQEMINVDGLFSVVWVLRKSLPLYLALKELEEFNTQDPNKQVIIIIHDLLDITVHFLQSPGRVCLQFKLIETNSRPLSVFVSEIFPQHPTATPSINGPPLHSQPGQLAQYQFTPLLPLWTQKSDIPGIVPLRQGLYCPIESIQIVVRRIRDIIFKE